MGRSGKVRFATGDGSSVDENCFIHNHDNYNSVPSCYTPKILDHRLFFLPCMEFGRREGEGAVCW